MRGVNGNYEGGGGEWGIMEVLLESVLLEMITEWKIIKIIRLCRIRRSFAFPQSFFAPPVEYGLSDMHFLRIRVRSFSLSTGFLLSELDLPLLIFSLMSPLNLSTRYAILFSFVFSCLPYCFLLISSLLICCYFTA